MRDIGKNIKDLRQTVNMTQEELAERLFVTRQTVSNYETGRTRPDLDMLMSVAQVLGTDVNTVLYGLPDAAARQRKLLRFAVTALILAVAAGLYQELVEWALDIQGRTHNMLWNILARSWAQPLVYVLLGWTLADALFTFGLLKSLRGRTAKRVGIGLAAATGLYFALTVPVIANWIFRLNLRGWFWECYADVMVVVLYRGLFLHLTVTVALGVLLRMLVPERKRE